MENENASTNELLAVAYERLWRHEQALNEVLIERDALKQLLTDGQRTQFEAAREKEARQLGNAFGVSRNAQWYADITERLRDGQ